MLISVACYQFSPFSLSPQNYKSVVSTAPFIPSVTAGDNYAQEARRGTYFGSSQEASGGSVLQGRRSTIDRGGCTLATGPFWGLFSEPPPGPRHQPWPVKISQNKTLRRVGDLEKEGWKKGRKWEATLDLLCLPSVLSLLPRTAFQQPKPSHIRTEEDVFVSLSRAHLWELCEREPNQNGPWKQDSSEASVQLFLYCLYGGDKSHFHMVNWSFCVLPNRICTKLYL